MNKKEAASLLISSLAITGGVVSAIVTAGATAPTLLILGGGLSALGGLGGNLASNCLQKNLIDKTPQEDVLKNGDLTRAIGKAIFKLCEQLAEEIKDSNDKKSLITLSKTNPEVWENLILGGDYQEGYGLSFSNLDLNEVSANRSTQYFQAEADKLDKLKTLTLQTWHSIIESLCQKQKCSLSKTVKDKLAEKLHFEFARALRKVLIADFDKDGKAYASMQFRLLSEILNYTKENYEQSESILAIVIDLSKKIDEINQTSPKNYSPDNLQDWQKIFDDFDSFNETLSKTYQNTEVIKADIKQILENQANQVKATKSKPQGLINLPREKNDFFCGAIENLFAA